MNHLLEYKSELGTPRKLISFRVCVKKDTSLSKCSTRSIKRVADPLLTSVICSPVSLGINMKTGETDFTGMATIRLSSGRMCELSVPHSGHSDTYDCLSTNLCLLCSDVMR